MLPLEYYFPNRGKGIWSSPDGHDPLNKLISGVNMGLAVSVPVGLALQLKLGSTLESPATFGRIIQASLPCCGAGAVFVSTSFMIARIRKKNDLLNNVLALFATVPITRRYFPACFTLLITGGLLAAVVVARCGDDFHEVTVNDRLLTFGKNYTNGDWYLWSQNKKPEEPYIKYKRTGALFWKF